VIEPLLAPPRMGRPVRDRRQVLNGILWKLSTGAAWRDLPERYGPWKTVYERFRRWSADGTWDRLLAHVQAAFGRGGCCRLDGGVCGLHDRAGSPACVRGPKRGSWPGEAIGRSRGGLTTKIHLACDGQGKPLAFTITGGNVNDCTQFEQVMARISVSRSGPGRPRTRPERVVADKGVLVQENPLLPAQTRHQSRDPGADRPDQRPHPTRREPVPARPSGLPAPHHR
jgi:transposase